MCHLDDPLRWRTGFPLGDLGLQVGAKETVRPAGIEPAACGLKDRCSLAPRREPLTTELRAREAQDGTTGGAIGFPRRWPSRSAA
jgi:hypothetical protein